jgi:peptidylprolyl isomerase
MSISTMFVIFVVLMMATVTFANQMSTQEGIDYLTANAEKRGVNVLPSGLQYKVLSETKNPNAPSPNATTLCHVHYRGTTVGGMEFDSSHKRKAPTKFTPQDVIAGWKEALMKMREGDKWQIVVPAELAYGKRKVGEYITPGSVLIFEMELVKVETEPSQLAPWNILPTFFKDIPTAMWVFVAYFLYQIFASSDPTAAGKPVVPLASVKGSEHNDIVYMEVQVGEDSIERVEFELFTKQCPKTTANFMHLCVGDKGKTPAGKDLTFMNSIFHRVIPGFMAQGGDFENRNGTGGQSIYGAKFADEWTNGMVPHTEPYLLSMANAGPGTNGSQFFITFAKTGWLDGKHVVFGRVVSGVETVKKIESVGSPSGKPHKTVTVKDSGIVKRGKPVLEVSSSTESNSNDVNEPKGAEAKKGD